MADKQKAVELKNKGNAALQQNNIEEAIRYYGEAIECDKENHVLYSNRSAAYAKAEKYEEALTDADKAVALKSDWPKGFSRRGAALYGLARYELASEAYEEGLKLDPNNQQMKEGLENAKKKLTGPGGSQPLQNPFMDPNLITKLSMDPRTRDYLKQQDFMQILENLKNDPKSLGNHLQDPRVMSSLSVLLGVNLQTMGDDDEAPEPMQQTPQSSASSAKPSESSSSKNSAKNTEEPMDEDLNENQKQALEEKKLGNEAYKKKNLDVALGHYDKAIELDPTNISFRTNRAAVFFEQKCYDKCIEECLNAVEVGRESRADYKLIAKALARIGNAYHKKDDLKNALTYYHKSLSEHRASDIMKKASDIEKLLKERERLAYMDPEKSLEEKVKGNEAFQKGDYPTAMKHYNEAVARNPKDAKVFSNRAACYMKLMEFNMALKDCDEAIKLDPQFVKAYLRKAACLSAMKNTTEAGKLYQKALEIDPQCQEAKDGYKNTVLSSNDPEVVKQRAMSDPEVQEILADPAMQLILQQMQKDPKALQEHIKNPAVAKKIEKLMASGLIAIR